MALVIFLMRFVVSMYSFWAGSTRVASPRFRVTVRIGASCVSPIRFRVTLWLGLGLGLGLGLVVYPQSDTSGLVVEFN